MCRWVAGDRCGPKPLWVTFVAEAEEELLRMEAKSNEEHEGSADEAAGLVAGDGLGGRCAAEDPREGLVCYDRSIKDEGELVRRLQEEAVMLLGQGKAKQASCRQLAGNTGAES